MWKFHFKKTLYKLFSVFCAVMILSISPCSKYIDATSIKSVYGTELVLAVEGGEIAIEYLIAFFAALGAGGIALENMESLASPFASYLVDKCGNGELALDSMQETCIQVYDKATNTIKNIPWEDMMYNLSEGHNFTINHLTGIYAKYCPALLGTMKDFVTDVLNGDVYVSGLSDTLMETSSAFSGYESIQNADGTYNISGYVYWIDSHGHLSEEIYSDSKPFRVYGVGDFVYGV